MRRLPIALLVLALAAIPSTAKYIVPGGDGVCAFDWRNDFEEMTRLTDYFDAGLGNGDSKTLLVPEATAGQFAQLRETWYVPRAAAICPTSTAPLYRTYNAALQDFRDSPLTNETPGYNLDNVLGSPGALACPWTSSVRTGLVPLTRFAKASISDAKTWIPTPPSGYVADATWSSGSTARLGYPRFGQVLEKDPVLAGPAYGTYSLDNGILHVDFNRVWGNGVGKITHLSSGQQIVSESIGAMVQTVARWGTGDPDCRTPNPTQSGGVHCVQRLPDGTTQPNLSMSERWAGSPVLSTTITGTDPKTLTSILRPFDFCHQGSDQRTPEFWVPKPDPFSPLAWKGLFQRSDTLSCKIGAAALVRRDVIKTVSRLKLGEGSPFSSQTLGALNTHWLRIAPIGDARVAGQVVLEDIDLTTGVRTPVSYTYVPAVGATPAYFDVAPGPTPIPGHNRAFLVSRGDGSFAFAVARVNAAAGVELTLSFHCGTSCGPDNTAVVIQASTNLALSSAAWSDPIESFLVINNRSVILTRLGELQSDGGNCDI
ncbi:MAG TPA: hypothetical protein VGS22_25085 [Thermoanaerobaculia bacterium]|jgi:hypothetical protein|nr:hypothetical protein [Thermoanaerobaculia bacterium]